LASVHLSEFFRKLWKLGLLFPASDINDPTQCGRLEKASITDDNIPSFRKFGGTQHEEQYIVTQDREKGLYATLCFCFVNDSDIKVVTCVKRGLPLSRAVVNLPRHLIKVEDNSVSHVILIHSSLPFSTFGSLSQPSNEQT